MSFKSNISALLLAASTAFMLAASPVFAQAEKPLTLAETAPDRYVVVRGDTLWGISGRFLKEPWRWPEIWGMNRAEIKNPQLIYPGNVLVLDRSGPTPRLYVVNSTGVTADGVGATVKLSPTVYGEAISTAIPSIASQIIEPFLSQPLFVDRAGLANSGRILAAQESRVYVGSDADAYITGLKGTPELGSVWQIYRETTPIKDPETKEVLGYEAKYLGTARVSLPGDPSKVRILSAKQEITPGDRVLPASVPVPIHYIPHAPDKRVAGRVIGLYDGVGTGETGRSSIVLLNRGARDGIEVGTILGLSRNGAYVKDPDDRRKEMKLPDERYGTVFVFRVFDRVSYALIGAVERPVAIADVISNP